MATISMFLGIIICMYNTGEHNPPHCAHIAGDSVAWNDELDIAPEHLYEYSKPMP